jgi:outer membrane receptor protein involved in Fe transport
MAVSGEVRNLTYSVSSDALPSQMANCTGLTNNCTSKTLLWADATLANRPQVGESVEEAAYELDAPIVANVPFAQNVSVNGAVRYANYSVSGSAWTWKAGLVWQVNDQLRLRATRSRDFRAPTLYDLYQPQAISQVQFLDSLTGNSPLANVHTGGNPNLKPEIGDTTSAGFVYQPSWLPRFSFSVDTYYIDVSQALALSTGYSPAIQAVCNASGGASPYCGLILRSPTTGQVTDWYSTTVNIADVKSYGVDFEANYATTVANNPLTLRALVTWQPHILYVTPGLNTVDQGGSGLNANNLFPAPSVRGTLFANYKIGNFNFGFDERIRSTINFVNDGTIHVTNSALPPLAYTDLNFTYSFDTPHLGRTEVFMNVQNLFNTMPPPIAGVQANANVGTFGGFATGQDDPIGRYFTLGVRMKL